MKPMAKVLKVSVDEAIHWELYKESLAVALVDWAGEQDKSQEYPPFGEEYDEWWGEIHLDGEDFVIVLYPEQPQTRQEDE